MKHTVQLIMDFYREFKTGGLCFKLQSRYLLHIHLIFHGVFTNILEQGRLGLCGRCFVNANAFIERGHNCYIQTALRLGFCIYFICNDFNFRNATFDLSRLGRCCLWCNAAS